MYIGKAALNIILSNLISNAINYTHEKDTVHIGIEQGYFFIQNKQDPTQSKGNGLGLSFKVVALRRVLTQNAS